MIFKNNREIMQVRLQKEEMARLLLFAVFIFTQDIFCGKKRAAGSEKAAVQNRMQSEKFDIFFWHNGIE